MNKTPQPISAIYCDDIRQEIGGKHSYMGVYGSDLVLPSFPAAIPKLCIAMQWMTLEKHVTQEVDLKVLLGHDRVLLNTTIAIDPDQLTQQIFIVLEPFKVQASTTLSVEVKGGNQHCRSTPLQIIASKNASRLL